MSATHHPYDRREQTEVKHLILRQYLLKLALIVGRWSSSITYVDCFSGPWESRTEDHSDTSFSIAIHQLKAARDVFEKEGKLLKLRCLFIEEDDAAYEKLERFSKTVTGVEILPIHGKLEDHIGAILDFTNKGGSSNFSFIFIDPTGWTGFPMQAIAPLLELGRAEVLVNFMSSQIRRFVDQEDRVYSKGFELLYGGPEFRSKLREASDDEKLDVMVSLYGQELKKRGKYKHVVYTPVFQPQKNDIHFYLIYASRHQKGLLVFKENEKKAVEAMEVRRAEAQQRERQSDGTLELFASNELRDASFFDSLRKKYLQRLAMEIDAILLTDTRVLFDDLLEAVLTIPLIWVSDLTAALSQMKRDKRIIFEGFKPKQTVPKVKEKNYVVRLT